MLTISLCERCRLFGNAHGLGNAFTLPRTTI
jgi:hypothetical protein